MDIHLTLNVNYLPSWGVKEGLRELVQNWLDAGPLGEPVYDGGTVALANAGNIDRSALLIGTTSKQGRTDQRGQFGEGLKLGALALVRAGKTVVVHAAAETWTARIVTDKRLGAKVLSWRIAPAAPIEGVCVLVGKVAADEWSEARSMFRRLDVATGGVGNAYDGAILFDRPGKLYVKGILVEEDAAYRFGYDFASATVDRDRRMVSSFDAAYHAARLLDDARRAGKIDGAALLRLMLEGKKDTGGMSFGPTACRQAIAASFRAEHGEMAIPVNTPALAREMESLGEKAVVLPASVCDTIAPHARSADEARVAAREAIVARHDRSELSDAERAALQWAERHAALAYGISAVPVPQVVTFRDPRTVGQFRRGEICIGRAGLSDPHETLATLIHEVGHFVARDGTREFDAVLESAWTRLAREFLAPPSTAPLSGDAVEGGAP